MPVKRKCKKKIKQISGRNVEKNIYNNIIKNKPKWWIFRYNENRRNPTPADIQISTGKYSVLVEVKATGIDHIQKANVRPKQRERLVSFKKANRKHNLGIVCLYFSRNRTYILVDIDILIKQAKSKITIENAKEIGVTVQNWKKIGKYFGQIYKKARISSGK